MKLTRSMKEERRQSRSRRADALEWRRSVSAPARTGWLLESSADGLAFVWRGVDPPRPSSVIELQLDAGHPNARWEQSVVRHITNVHGDLCVVGVELLRFRDFPPAPAATLPTLPRTPQSESMVEPRRPSLRAALVGARVTDIQFGWVGGALGPPHNLEAA